MNRGKARAPDHAGNRSPLFVAVRANLVASNSVDLTTLTFDQPSILQAGCEDEVLLEAETGSTLNMGIRNLVPVTGRFGHVAQVMT